VFPLVPVRPKRLDDYVRAAGEEAIERCRRAAEPLRGARVLHINSTAFGGGVAELLYTLVPLSRDLGMETDWAIFPGNHEFFEITKAVHNGCQGMPVMLSDKMRSDYISHTVKSSTEFSGEYDFVVVHDPQPAALLHALRDHGRQVTGKWIWRCHIDLTAASPEIWYFLAPYLNGYDAAIFTHPDFAKPLEIPLHFIAPSIDPRSPKNARIHDSTVVEVLERYDIDQTAPIVCQVSRFDPWKDPLGVIDAYRLVKKEIPEIQLIMVASMAHDDPEGMHYLELTEERRDGDPDIFLLTNLQGVGAVEVNAFQRSSNVVVQKSLREGFGLVVSEAMWKSKPVVGGDTGGIRLQIDDGVNGFLVESIEETADRVLQLLRDPKRSERMGKVAKEKVREHFLSPRHLNDYLELMAGLK
jgi:trehalose synthase